MPDILKRKDGVVLTLPDLNMTSSTNCSHTVSIDGIPLEVSMAVRYLLADRERIRTLLADAKAAQDE